MPKQSIDDRYALLLLRSVLLETTDKDHPLSRRQINEEMQKQTIVEEMTYYRFRGNIRALKDSGLDIKGIRGRGNYFYYVGIREFQFDELLFLAYSIRSSRFISPGILDKLVHKIGKLTSRYLEKSLFKGIGWSGYIRTSNDNTLKNLQSIHFAVMRNKKIRFSYYKWVLNRQPELKDDGIYHVVSPYFLWMYCENCYLLAYNTDSGTEECYLVERMEDITELEEGRDNKKKMNGKSIGDIRKMCFGMKVGVEENVLLKFHQRLLDAVVERFGTDIKIKTIDEDYFTLYIKVYISDDFYGWLFGLGAGVKILSPEWVIGGFIDLKDDVFEQYRLHGCPEKDE